VLKSTRECCMSIFIILISIINWVYRTGKKGLYKKCPTLKSVF